MYVHTFAGPQSFSFLPRKSNSLSWTGLGPSHSTHTGELSRRGYEIARSGVTSNEPAELGKNFREMAKCATAQWIALGRGQPIPHLLPSILKCMYSVCMCSVHYQMVRNLALVACAPECVSRFDLVPAKERSLAIRWTAAAAAAGGVAPASWAPVAPGKSTQFRLNKLLGWLCLAEFQKKKCH